MKASITIFFLLLIAGLQAYEVKTDCKCPGFDGKFPDSSYQAQTQSSNLLYSDYDLVVDGVNYGKLIWYANMIWVSKEILVSSAFHTISGSCPSGYRFPTVEELKKLNEAVVRDYPNDQMNFLRYKFGMSSTKYYMSSTKTYPDKNDCGDGMAWMYDGLYFVNGTIKVGEVSTYWNGRNLRTKCVFDPTSSTQNADLIWNVPEAFVNQKKTLELWESNYDAVAWKANGELLGSGWTMDWVPNYVGCHVIETFVAIFNGNAIMRQCLIFWADPQFGSLAETSFDKSAIQSKVFEDFQVTNQNSMHFTPSTAPIAPKKDGGAYIIFSSKDAAAGSSFLQRKRKARGGEGSLFVRVIDNHGNDVQEPIPLNRNGYPFDIDSTPWGFVTLIKDKEDENRLYLLGVYANGTERFCRNIMNNGPQPTEAIDQLKFYRYNNETLNFGMNAMFKPSNGKVAFNKGRIGVIFAHYNHFGFYDNGNRNDHTGDTVLSFDENGENEYLLYDWFASHSLNQQLIATPSGFMFASLSDAYPQNIKFGYSRLGASQADPYTKILNIVRTKIRDDLLSGSIPGDGTGSSCGTLGGMNYIGDEMFVFTYYRKACTTSFTSNNLTEIGILYGYTTSLYRIRRSVIVDGIQNVNVLKSANYGKYILVVYGTTKDVPETYPIRHTDPASDNMNIMLVSVKGYIITETSVVSPYSMTANDDLEVLSDGSVVWGFVNENGHFVFYRLPISDNPAFLQHYQKENGNKKGFEEEESEPKLVKNSFGKKSRKIVS